MGIQMGSYSISAGFLYNYGNILSHTNGYLHRWYFICSLKRNYIYFIVDPTTVLHYVIFYIVSAIPLVYMQIVVGQYSQLGVIFFKYLTPIGHGIGFALCINSIWSCIVKGVFMGDFSLYFLSAMKSELPWMKCPENHPKCWVSSKNCTSNCFSTEKKLSSFVFWR